MLRLRIDQEHHDEGLPDEGGACGDRHGQFGEGVTRPPPPCVCCVLPQRSVPPPVAALGGTRRPKPFRERPDLMGSRVRTDTQTDRKSPTKGKYPFQAEEQPTLPRAADQDRGVHPGFRCWLGLLPHSQTAGENWSAARSPSSAKTRKRLLGRRGDGRGPRSAGARAPERATTPARTRRAGIRSRASSAAGQAGPRGARPGGRAGCWGQPRRSRSSRRRRGTR